MNYIISQNVPMCPKCSAMMYRREQDHKLFMICADCLKTYQVIDVGQSEIELVISDHNCRKCIYFMEIGPEDFRCSKKECILNEQISV